MAWDFMGLITSNFVNMFIRKLGCGALRDRFEESAIFGVIGIWQCTLEIDQGEGVGPLRPFVSLILVALSGNRG